MEFELLLTQLTITFKITFLSESNNTHNFQTNKRIVFQILKFQSHSNINLNTLI